MATEIQTAESLPRRMIQILMDGDLSRLSDEERALYYVHECNRMGLDPAARPLEWMRLQGKLTLYAKRVAGDMLAAKHRVTIALVAGPDVREFGETKVLFAHARATMPDGRSVEDVATMPAADLANGIMKVTSKAFRRATLRLCGWGGLDESEVEDLRAEPHAAVVADVTVVAGLPPKAAASEPPPAPADQMAEAAALIEELINTTSEEAVAAVNARADKALAKGSEARKRYSAAMKAHVASLRKAG